MSIDLTPPILISMKKETNKQTQLRHTHAFTLEKEKQLLTQGERSILTEEVFFSAKSFASFLTDRRVDDDRSLMPCSCSSNNRRRCSVRLVEIGPLLFDGSSLVVVVVSKAVFNSPTRLVLGRSNVEPVVLSNCCCSNLDRRSSMIADDDDERLGG